MSDKKTLLVVEDDADLRGLLVGKLKQKGFNVLEASDGEDAVTKVVDHGPQLILLDLMIPKLDGFGVLERIRKFPDDKIARTPVIVLSNLWSNKDILRVKALYIDEYYVKANTDLNQVYEKVADILQRGSSVAAAKM